MRLTIAHFHRTLFVMSNNARMALRKMDVECNDHVLASARSARHQRGQALPELVGIMGLA